MKDRNGLQKLVYADIKAAFGLSAQPAVRVVKKVVDAYGALAANRKAGRLGGPGTQRYRKAVGSPVTFRPEAAQPFDDRCLSWQTDARTVSIWTVDGRLRGIRYTGSPDQLKTLAEHRKGESDLVQRDGKWFLIATCDIPDPEVHDPTDWMLFDRSGTVADRAGLPEGDRHPWLSSLGKQAQRQAVRTGRGARRGRPPGPARSAPNGHRAS